MILVTGGAGFIGSALIWELNRRGITDIIACDHLGSSQKWMNLRGLKFKDYMEKHLLLQNLERLNPNFVFHLGACSSTTETDMGYLIANNFEFSKELARFCIARKVPFVYASSAATYGDGLQGFSDQCDLETLRPLNGYGYSKHLFDLWALQNKVSHHLTAIKFFNVWGPNEYHKGSMRSMVVKAFEQIQSRGSVQLFKSYHPAYKDGEQVRDFIYVKDVTRMLLEFYDRPETTGIYNLGNGKTVSWLELLTPVFNSLGLEPAFEFVDMPLELRSRYQYHTCADMQKFDSTGLKRFQTPLAEAVHDFVTNYLVPGRYLESST